MQLVRIAVHVPCNTVHELSQWTLFNQLTAYQPLMFSRLTFQWVTMGL